MRQSNTLSRSFLLFLLLTLLLNPFSPVSATSESWDLVGQVGGQSQAVAASGSIALVGIGMHLSTLDISNPSSPALMGSSEPFNDFVRDVILDGTIAYVAAGAAGMKVVDFTSPSAPQLVGSFASHGYAEGVAVADNYVYLADGADGLRILDIANPANPIEVAAVFQFFYAHEITVLGDLALVAGGSAGLLIADITDPTHPQELAILDTPGFAYGVAAADQTAFVADAWQGVHSISLTNPAYPALLASYPTPGWALAVELSGSSLYVANGVNGLRILNVSNPSAMYEAGALANHENFVRKLALNGSTLLLADRALGLRLVNPTDPADPQELGAFSQMSEARYVAVDGDYAYIAAGNEGNMYIINIANPADPYQVSQFIGGGYTSGLAVKDQYVYFSTFMDAPNYLWVIDKTNPSSPSLAAVVPLDSLDPVCGAARDVAIQGNFIYVADEWGMRVYDITNPLAIHLEGQIETLGIYGETTGLDVSGNYAYLAASGNGVIVMDITNPANPTYVANTPSAGFTQAVDVSGTTLYVSNASGPIDVYDISNPHAIPPVLDSFDTPGYINGLRADGSTLFASDGGGGVQLINISDPSALTLQQTIATPGFAYYSVPSGDLLYVAGGLGGLLIYQRTTTRAKEVESQATFAPITSTQGQPNIIHPHFNPLTAVQRMPSAGADGIIRATCTVTKTADNTNTGTLRTCMKNATPGTLINFSTTTFPPASPAVITLASLLPELNDGNVIIDASNAGVILDGGNNIQNGLTVSSSNNTIMGLQIRNFTSNGIALGFPGTHNQVGGDHTIGAGPSGQGNVLTGCFNGISVGWTSQNVIKGNFIGTNAGGTAASSRNNIGIVIGNEATENFVGGLTPGERNIIGNCGRGIDLADSTCQFNTVSGNFIGTDISGSYAIPNDAGIMVEVGTRNNIIGGTTPAERNLVSGNNFGITLTDPPSSQNSVIGNWVGVDATGTYGIPNSGKGISVFSTGFNRVGGSLPGEANLVNGATYTTAIGIGGFEFSDAIVLGNRLGYNSKGMPGPGNGTAIGIETPHNFIGGLGSGDANLLVNNEWGIAAIAAASKNNWIAGNQVNDGGMGVYLSPGADHNFVMRNQVSGANEGVRVEISYRNTIRANSISSCGWKGIFLLDGGNYNHPAPTISSFTEAGISGTSCPLCIVDVYSDPTSQGLIYEGSTLADLSGNFNFARRLLGPNVTLTSTDPDGNTSEFSFPNAISWAWLFNFLPLLMR